MTEHSEAPSPRPTVPARPGVSRKQLSRKAAERTPAAHAAETLEDSFPHADTSEVATDADIDALFSDDGDPAVAVSYNAGPVAEHEREMISQRTKAALAAAKARGVKLGNPRGAAHLVARCREAGIVGGALRRQRAQVRAEAIAGVMAAADQENCSLRSIAQKLNTLGVAAPRGGVWHAAQVNRIREKSAPQ